MKLTFLGATQTVTGSKYLVETDDRKILVDCGLFQGMKDLRIRNWEPLPIEASKLDAILLTHAHIDHSGYIPKLIKSGFRGKIYASEATIDLCRILLPDSGYLQEEDARQANLYGYAKHKPALPLYTQLEAEAALDYFEAVSIGNTYSLSEDLSVTFHRAGHILGATFITLHHHHTNLTFSGDLGRPHDPVMKSPVNLDATDYLVMESTYGDRLHDTSDPLKQLEEIILRTIKRGGTLLIASFAVGRAQSLLYYLYQLKQQDRIPQYVQIFLDSPMAIDATELMLRHRHDHRLSETDCIGACQIARYIQTPDESKKLNTPIPKIIIAASGMATGGRVLHHLKYYAPDRRNTLLFTGFQAEGTRGEKIVRGDQSVKIHGQNVSIHAEVQNMHNISAHADYEEILNWLGHIKSPPMKTFITHGTPSAADSLKSKIEESLGWNATIPTYLQTEIL